MQLHNQRYKLRTARANHVTIAQSKCLWTTAVTCFLNASGMSSSPTPLTLLSSLTGWNPSISSSTALSNFLRYTLSLWECEWSWQVKFTMIKQLSWLLKIEIGSTQRRYLRWRACNSSCTYNLPLWDIANTLWELTTGVNNSACFWRCRTHMGS